MSLSLVPQALAAINPSQTPINPALKNTTAETLCRLNPLVTNKGQCNPSYVHPQFGTVGGIISALLAYIFPLAGILLFVLIVASGIQMAAAGMNGNQNSFNAGKKRLIAAIVGFIIVLSAYLIMTIIQSVLGIQIDGLQQPGP
jgi:uncharacterized membrane protein YbjE (DUF340 family)